MTRKKVYLLIQMILCILLCLLLSLAVLRIYREGVKLREAGDYLTWIYTREKVAERFGPISPLFFGAIGFMIAGLVLGLKDDRLDKPVPDAEVMRDLYCRKVTTPTAQMTMEREKQKKLRIIGLVLAAVCAVPVFIYMVNTSHFDGSSPAMIDHSFLSMLLHIIPWTAIGLGCLSVTETLREKSMNREAELAKDAIKELRRAAEPASGGTASSSAEPVSGGTASASAEQVSGGTASSSAEPASGGTALSSAEAGAQEASGKDNIPETETGGAVPGQKHTMMNVVRVVVFAAAVILIIHGINNGSMEDVLVKATHICTECIGLG